MGSVRRSFVFLIIQNYYAVALQLVGTMIISRILTPGEIGIYAIAAVLGALAGQLRDFGLQEYLIQEKELTHAKIRAAFGMNIITSWTMAALFLFGSSHVGEFYREPGVTEVMRIQAMSLLIVPFGAINMAYFRRELNYKPNLVAGLCSNTISFAVALTLVLNGFSYLSMAWSAFAGVLVSVTISLAFRPKDYPRLPSFAGLRRVFHFSKHAMSIYVLGQVNKGAPEAIIGRIQDAAAVAFFSRAYGMIEIFNRMIVGPTIELCLPYLAKSSRAGEPTRIGYLKAITLLTGVGWPFFCVAGTLAYSMIYLLYGGQWEASVPLAQILCATAIVELLYWLSAEAMIAEGCIKHSNLLKFLLLILKIAGILFIIPFGLMGVCWGLLAASVLGAVASHMFLHRIISLEFRDVFKACLPSAMTAVICAVPNIFIVAAFGQHHDNAILLLIASGALSFVVWLFAIRLLQHPIWNEVVLLKSKIIGRFTNSA
jgi:O-antigen/teichoic acid export membrane protein